MTTVHTLASGSSGNALVISCGETHLLLDAGISCRRISTALRELELTPADLTAILITHTHTDHIAGLSTLLKRCEAPVIGTRQTLWTLADRLGVGGGRLEPLEPGAPAALGDCQVSAFPTSHDAPGSCGYRIDTGDGSVGVLTDSGFVTDEAAETLTGVDLAVLEANHDVETLQSGPYPYYLKRRILGDHGHLSNEAGAALACTAVRAGARTVILAHLSAENNTPARARNAVALALSAMGADPDRDLRLSVAPRAEPGLCCTA